MGWTERLFGNRGKHKEVEKAAEKAQASARGFWDRLRGKPALVSRNCPVCNSPNPVEAEVCWKCQKVF